MEVLNAVRLVDFEHYFCLKTACTLLELCKGWKYAFYLSKKMDYSENNKPYNLIFCIMKSLNINISTNERMDFT